MRESEHFNLNLVEGTDIVNPLVTDVPNYESIDAQMFKNQNAGVQNATELKSGTVHAITRIVPDAQFITFTATSNYTAGETFTVDGVQVTALTVGGETLPTGAYVINSQVLCVLKGTLLTVYGVGSEVADNALALNGHPDTYFGTKEEVDNAIDTANAANELVKNINNSLTNIDKQYTVLFDKSGSNSIATTNDYVEIPLNDVITNYRFIVFDVYTDMSLQGRRTTALPMIAITNGVPVYIENNQNYTFPFSISFTSTGNGNLSYLLRTNPVKCRILGVK